MPGARSSSVHAVAIQDRLGRRTELVLRRYVRADWMARTPDLAEREAEALVIVESCGLATPVLVAADVSGHRTDVPAVLMTRVAGLPGVGGDLSPDEIRRLAEALPVVHATPIPSGASVRPYAPYDHGAVLTPPPWSSDDHLWHRAIAVHRRSPVLDGPVLVHRDYHPANVLFGGAGHPGVVDWVNASRGVPDVDVGHCRFNLAGQHSRVAADQFRDAWLAASGRGSYDPTYDIVAVVGALTGWPSELFGRERVVEQLVASALAELGA